MKRPTRPLLSRSLHKFALLIGGFMVSLSAPSAHANSPAQARAVDRARIAEDYAKLPLSFVENQGQAEARVAYTLQAASYSMAFTRDGHALRLVQSNGESAKAHTITVELLGAKTERISSRERAPGTVNLFKGTKEQWRVGIPTHTAIAYERPWPGIELTYSSDGGKLESIYTIAPNADPSRIKLRYAGHESLKLDRDGNLVYVTSVGEVKESAPILLQNIDGQRIPVKGSYRLLDKNTVGFKVARYDRKHPLTIDPTLIYSGFIGGSFIDEGRGIALDAAGNAYIVGSTYSPPATFPRIVGPDLSFNATGGSPDVFVAKVNPAGTALLYSGYIGGAGGTRGFAIAADSAGNAFVTGITYSTPTTFPLLGGPAFVYNGSGDAFVAKINPAGTLLLYCGYIGGFERDDGNGIAVDNAGNAYVVGSTQSDQSGFPVTVGPDGTFAGGMSDGFITKVSPNGTLVYSGYIGGDGYDGASGVDVDNAGNAYVIGSTGSLATTFPVLVGPDLSQNGNTDAFITKVNANGTAFVYSGYIGGFSDDQGYAVAVNGAGNAYVTGITQSSEVFGFPVLNGPDITHNGSQDVFVGELNAAGSGFVYLGYIGGAQAEQGYGIAIDGGGNAYVTGRTQSNETTFPVLGGPDLSHNSNWDAFVSKVNPLGTALVYSGYIGGLDLDGGYGIAVDSAGSAFIVGDTYSTQTTFPLLGGLDATSNGNVDVFVAKVTDFLDYIYSNGFQQ